MNEADAVLVVARTGTSQRGGAELSLFLVPTDAPGLEARVLPVDIMLPEKQFTLHFDDVRLGPEALLGAAGQGFRQVFHGLNPERITGAAACVGIARYVLAGRPGTPPNARSGRRRSAPTRAWPTRWPGPRSRPSWPR